MARRHDLSPTAVFLAELHIRLGYGIVVDACCFSMQRRGTVLVHVFGKVVVHRRMFSKVRRGNRSGVVGLFCGG